MFDDSWCENIVDFENMDNAIQDLYNEKLHGEGIYTLNNGVQVLVLIPRVRKEVRMILKSVMRRFGRTRILNNMKWEINKCRHDDVEYGDGLRGRNSNVVQRQKFEW